MQLMDNEAAAWLCVLAGAAAHGLLLGRCLHRGGAPMKRILPGLLLPVGCMLLLAKLGFVLLQEAESRAGFSWCFTLGLAGLMLGTALAARCMGQRVMPVLDGTAPGLCVAMALARLSQRWLGEVGIGPYLEDGSLLLHSPFVLVNTWQEAFLAVFLLESLAALLACAVTLLTARQHRSGAAIGCALTWLTVPQILLEQLRSGWFLRWRMVRLEQVLCALAALAVLGCFGFAMRRRERVSVPRAYGSMAVFLLLCGLVAAMQFALDGKLMLLPEGVVWAVYGLSILAMLALEMDMSHHAAGRSLAAAAH